MHAHCRHDRINRLQPETISLLQANDVELLSISNPFHDGYPAGNKIAGAALEREAQFSVFLDTDSFLIRETSFLDIAEPGKICLCPETRNAWTNRPRVWRRVYAQFGLPKPTPDLQLLLGDLSHPFFNAGMVLFPSGDFGKLWLDTALNIDEMEGIHGRRPWLDQISLPVAVARLGDGALKIVDRAWNDTPDIPNEDTRLLHYHRPRRLRVRGKMHLADVVFKASDSAFASYADVIAFYSGKDVVADAKALNFKDDA
ncbi:hypothetical protein HW561_14745 [Rhodobacteraceae bacterium B1Z28]|uniref:Glycosyl transferase family 2 n=1 Tax=Ruegeria haliotis TaxID=2747601 RepID=A0ABX2PUK1_9RHOB|nr:hypothetical protein [Ruegeria haliotis]NVO57051.1 hypothetical protein [Ruegeria haliotis]